MWITKKIYKQLKRRQNEVVHQRERYRALCDELSKELIILQSEYDKLKEAPLKLFGVEIYLKFLHPVEYNIIASSPEQAEQYAIKMFVDRNKDFSASDIVMVTIKHCAR